jgi:hypothetical protein
MASKTQTTAAATIDQPTPVVQQSVEMDSKTRMEYLVSQQKAIRDAIKETRAADKAAKAANRGNSLQERLAKEIETQELAPSNSLTYQMFTTVNRRVQLGQDPEEAKQAVLAICARLIDSGLANGNPFPAKAN